MMEGLAACFAGLADPRETRRCDHRLIDILVIAVCAVIACAESWEDIELYGRSKQAWLKTFLVLPNGIPSHDTFRRVFMLLDPDAFEACFARWARSLMGKVEREVVAIDGLFVCQDLGTIALKGLPEPVPAWQVLSAGTAEGRFEALHGTITPLVGREEEIELLLRRWTQAKGGSGKVVLISAEPGVGKSRLAEALVERVALEPHIRLRYFCSPHHQDS